MNKKITSLLLILAMLTIMLNISGCSKSTSGTTDKATTKVQGSNDVKGNGKKALDADNVNSKGVFPVVKNPTKLTIAIPTNPKIENFDTNQYTQYIEKKTGVDLQFQFLPSGTETMQKAMLMFASNDLPDIFVGVNFSDVTLLDYGSQGSIIPLNDLINTYGVEMQNMWAKALDDTNLKKTMTFSDGNIYYVPKYSEQTQNTYNIRCYVYEPWLKTLGLSLPTTLDQYYNMLLAFRDKDLNGNGKKDEIPLIDQKLGNIPQFFINSFIHDSGSGENHLILKNGKVDVNYNKPEFKESLMWLNKLVSEKLLDPMTFTQDTAQLKVLMTAPQIIVGSICEATKTGVLDRNVAETKKRSDDYVPLLPLKGPSGVAYCHPTPTIPQPMYIITSACKNPAAAYRVGDLMLSYEASLDGRIGFEGQDWYVPKNGVVGANGQQATIAFNRDVWGMKTHNVHWQYCQPGFFPRIVFDTKARPDDPKDYDYVQITNSYELSKFVPKEVVPRKLSYTIAEMDQFATLQPSISTYVEENITKFIVGDKKFSEWDAYVAELNKLQIDKFIKLVQTAYDRTISK